MTNYVLSKHNEHRFKSSRNIHLPNLSSFFPYTQPKTKFVKTNNNETNLFNRTFYGNIPS